MFNVVVAGAGACAHEKRKVGKDEENNNNIIIIINGRRAACKRLLFLAERMFYKNRKFVKNATESMGRNWDPLSLQKQEQPKQQQQCRQEQKQLE